MFSTLTEAAPWVKYEQTNKLCRQQSTTRSGCFCIVFTGSDSIFSHLSWRDFIWFRSICVFEGMVWQKLQSINDTVVYVVGIGDQVTMGCRPISFVYWLPLSFIDRHQVHTLRVTHWMSCTLPCVQIFKVTSMLKALPQSCLSCLCIHIDIMWKTHHILVIRLDWWLISQRYKWFFLYWTILMQAMPYKSTVFTANFVFLL